MNKVYYAHHIWKYDTKIEAYELSLIATSMPDAIIVNPNTSVDQGNPEEKIMFDCFAAIKECDALVFSDISGVTGKGVISEIEYAQSLGLRIYRIVANRMVEITEKIKYNLLNTGNSRIYAEIVT
jgi:hypothetical protein